MTKFIYLILSLINLFYLFIYISYVQLYSIYANHDYVINQWNRKFSFYQKNPVTILIHDLLEDKGLNISG